MDWALTVAGEALAAVLAAIVLAALGWIASSIRDLRREIAALRDAGDLRLDRVEKQIVKVEDLERHEVIRRLGEAELKLAELEAGCLGKESLDRIHERVDDLTKEVHSLGGKFESAAGSLALIHSFLLDGGGK